MSCDVRQNAINTMKSENVIDEKRAITNKYKFSRLNEELTKNAEKFYNLDAKGELMFTIVSPERQADKYDRLVGYSNKSYYDLNDKLFDELQRLEDLQASAEVKLKDNSVVGKPDNLQYRYSFINIIQDNKSKIDKWNNQLKDIIKVFTKIQQDLQIPKDLLNLLKESEGNTIDEKITNFISNYSYTVEINTATKNEIGAKESYNPETGEVDIDIIEPDFDYIEEYDEDGNIIGMKPVLSEKGKKQLEETPTQYYSNLTVPGGTNYTENEIATPAITPSIKGHAQFATDKGIGWFRSDEKIPSYLLSYNEKEEAKKLSDKQWEGSTTKEEDDRLDYLTKNLETKITTKTRRILEVQSDLFQKGRDRKDLTGTYSEYVEGVGEMVGLEEKPSNPKGNQFLQLLNKDNNWVTFFIKSIIQDSAKKGYEKVLFPSGNTASKVEGHQTLETRKQNLFDSIKLNKDKIVELQNSKYEDGNYAYTKEVFEESRIEGIKELTDRLKVYETQLKDLEEGGFAKLKPIYNFYENTVTNILKKNFDIKVVTDEYGNTWNEVELNKNRDFKPISLLMSNNLNYLSSDEDIIEELIQEGKLKTKCD